jgi:hypothetical protein
MVKVLDDWSENCTLTRFAGTSPMAAYHSIAPVSAGLAATSSLGPQAGILRFNRKRLIHHLVGGREQPANKTTNQGEARRCSAR